MLRPAPRLSTRLAAFALVLISSIGVSLSAPAFAADAAPPERIGRSNDRPLVQPAGTLRFTLSTPLRDTGYLVQVLVPKGRAPDGGWPVLYAMDGKAIFDLLGTLLEKDTSKLNAVVVGISYDSPGLMDFRARSYDYTPPSPGDDAPVGSPRDPDAQGRVPPGGGAEAFLTYLLSNIEPVVAQRVPIDAANRSLYGHSYGGLFVLYAYLAQPQGFAHYFAASPSLWWNRQALMKKLPGQWPPGDKRGTLTMMVGEAEGGADIEGSAVGKFRNEITRQPGAQVSFEVMPGLSHGPMMPASLTRTLEMFRSSGNP